MHFIPSPPVIKIWFCTSMVIKLVRVVGLMKIFISPLSSSRLFGHGLLEQVCVIAGAFDDLFNYTVLWTVVSKVILVIDLKLNVLLNMRQHIWSLSTANGKMNSNLVVK